jgi:hypothetical protein
MEPKQNHNHITPSTTNNQRNKLSASHVPFQKGRCASCIVSPAIARRQMDFSRSPLLLLVTKLEFCFGGLAVVRFIVCLRELIALSCHHSIMRQQYQPP